MTRASSPQASGRVPGRRHLAQLPAKPQGTAVKFMTAAGALRGRIDGLVAGHGLVGSRRGSRGAQGSPGGSPRSVRRRAGVPAAQRQSRSGARKSFGLADPSRSSSAREILRGARTRSSRSGRTRLGSARPAARSDPRSRSGSRSRCFEQPHVYRESSRSCTTGQSTRMGSSRPTCSSSGPRCSPRSPTHSCRRPSTARSSPWSRSRTRRAEHAGRGATGGGVVNARRHSRGTFSRPPRPSCPALRAMPW